MDAGHKPNSSDTRNSVYGGADPSELKPRDEVF